jgi:hypothetical protein
MRDIADCRGPGSDWPGDDKLQALSDRGTPLSIWVEVAAAFIKRGIRPDERLDRVLKSDSSGSEYKQLDLLYTTVEGHFGEEDDNAAEFRNIMGIIVILSLHTPLPMYTLIRLNPLIEASEYCVSVKFNIISTLCENHCTKWLENSDPSSVYAPFLLPTMHAKSAQSRNTPGRQM